MELGQISYGQYAQALTPDNFAILNGFLHNEKAWTEMISISYPFICKDDGVIAGMAFLIPSGNPTDIYDTAWCYIRMVGVHPDYAGQGIGKKLTLLCIEKAKELKEQTIALHTSEFMDAARHIYEKIGFTVLREIAPRFGKRYWLYTLAI
jgi:ribosomal protein S18 acetylase RimI-like enzyme